MRQYTCQGPQRKDTFCLQDTTLCNILDVTLFSTTNQMATFCKLIISFTFFVCLILKELFLYTSQNSHAFFFLADIQWNYSKLPYF